MASVEACSRGLFRGRSESISSFRFFSGSESGSDVEEEEEGLAGWSFAVVVPVVVAPSQVLLLLLLGTVDSGVLDFIR